MKKATKQELDVGLAAAHQAIAEIRQQIRYARSPYEAEKYQDRLDEAVEYLDMIESEIERRRHARERVYC